MGVAEQAPWQERSDMSCIGESAAKMARLLTRKYEAELSRKTVWIILCRRDV